MSTSNQDDPMSTPSEIINNRREEEDDIDDDAQNEKEINAMRARVVLMESEAAKLRLMTIESERIASQAAAEVDGMITDDEKEATDSRSVYVGNVTSSFSFPLYHSLPPCLLSSNPPLA
jgi:hypothetical protein